MSGFEVIWTPRAEQQLADLWLAATDREALREAVEGLDRRLARDPMRCGESRDRPGVRVVVEPPLVVHVQVIEADRRVRVGRVDRLRSRPSGG